MGGKARKGYNFPAEKVGNICSGGGETLIANLTGMPNQTHNGIPSVVRVISVRCFFPTSAVIIQFFQSNHNSIQVNIWNGFSPSGVTPRTCAGFRQVYRMSVNFRPVSGVCNVCEAKILQKVLIFTVQRKVVNVVSIPNYNYIISQQGHVIISQKFPLAICVRRSVKSAFSLMMKIL